MGRKLFWSGRWKPVKDLLKICRSAKTMSAVWLRGPRGVIEWQSRLACAGSP